MRTTGLIKTILMIGLSTHLFASESSRPGSSSSPRLQHNNSPTQAFEDKTPMSSSKLLILAIDGTRPDALMMADTPFFHDFIAHPHTKYTLHSESIERTMSAASWTSIFSGLKETTHNILDNETVEANGEFTMPPTYMNHLQNSSSSPKTSAAVVSNWIGMKHLQEKMVDTTYFFEQGSPLENDRTATEKTIELLGEKETPEILLVYIANVDEEGHDSGFALHNPRYLQAISEMDQSLGQIWQALQKRQQQTKESWLVLITTDHGGSDRQDLSDALHEKHKTTYSFSRTRGIHGLDIITHRSAFLFVNHHSLAGGEILPSPRSLDITPSILKHFHAKIPPHLPGEALW